MFPKITFIMIKAAPVKYFSFNTVEYDSLQLFNVLVPTAERSSREVSIGNLCLWC